MYATGYSFTVAVDSGDLCCTDDWLVQAAHCWGSVSLITGVSVIASTQPMIQMLH